MKTQRIISTLAVAVIVIGVTLLLITALASARWTADDPASQGAAALAEQAAPERLLTQQWEKWINDVPWNPDLIVTVETSDTIKVVDAVTTLPTEPLELVENWDPARLKLLDFRVEPDGSQVVPGDGRLVWQVPEGGARVFRLTKWFHVEPSTWTNTLLNETLSVQGQVLEERVVSIEKAPPLLWIDSAYDPRVLAGDIATFTLSYGNNGGFENGVTVQNLFPRDAPFAWSDPPPDEVSADRLSATWSVGALARGDVGEVTVAIAIADSVPISTSLQVRDAIYDHVGEEWDFVVSTFHVEPPPQAAWGKWINGLAWNPDLAVTAETSDTIRIVDVVESVQPFNLVEWWDPGHLALVTYQSTAGRVFTSAGNLEWAVPAAQGTVTLTKLLHVEPGHWRRTVLEEVLAVEGTPDPLVRLVPVEHLFPPVDFPGGDWPWYAQEEITVHPFPPIADHPTEICAEVVNYDPDNPQSVTVEFAVANFGIGLPFTPLGRADVMVPAGGHAQGCIVWVPPTPDHWCIEARLLRENVPYARSQRNVDVDEPLRPNTPHSRTFLVGNPLPEPTNITLGLIPHLPNWGLELSTDVLRDMQPGEVRDVTLTVTPPARMPPDGTVVVDVEAYAGERLVGGFRKIFRPPVILHRFPDPPYAEREITVEPYPPEAGRPTEVCVELRNPTPYPQDVQVQFSWADFGIGIPFTPIDGLRTVHLPPYSVVRECIHWVPPVSGHVCLQVELFMQGYEPQRSQRNIDVNEPLEPNTPHSLTFPVGNPLPVPMTITLGLIPHLPDWGLELSADVLRGMQPGEVRDVTLTVTPPADLPEDGQAIVDVEAYAGERLIGGFRKIFRPPVPVHRPRDPVYAESEIFVDPYPVIPGVPTNLGVEVFNPTDEDQVVMATFSIAPFGIGLPFNANHITPNPIRIFVPSHGAARGHVVWQPPSWRGKFCVRVTLQMEGQEPIWSQRNIDVGEPLEPGVPHALTFAVGGWPHTEPVSISLGLIPHREDWSFELSQDVLRNVQPGRPVSVTLTVTPPDDARLATGEPIVDVEAFVEGELLGGFRKLDVPPIPIHKPHEPTYAESEIIIDPYPPQIGHTTHVSAVLQNNGDAPVTIDLEFGWARFGFGIPFSTTGMTPYARTVTLDPGTTTTSGVEWTPVLSGHQCVQVWLTDPEGNYEPQLSQRNVDVVGRPPCGETGTYPFIVRNDSPFTITVDVGLATFNVPADWEVTTVPSDAFELGPFSEAQIMVRVRIPCPLGVEALQARLAVEALQQAAGAVPTVDVEGYSDGALLGGIELQFPSEGGPSTIYLPLVLKGG